MGNEKRQNTRVHTVHLVSYTKFTPEHITEMMGLGNTIDLSEGGLRLTLKEPLEKGDMLHLDFTVEGKVIKTGARVIHVEEVKHYNIGFEFMKGTGDEALDPDEAAKIEEYLKKHTFRAGKEAM